MTALTMHTERLRLRPLTPDDLDRLIVLDADPGVLRYITGGAPLSREDMIGWALPRFLSAATQGDGLGFYAAHAADTDSFVGWGHLRRDEREPAWIELGYRLRTAWWGRGLATELSRALLSVAFDHRADPVVSARTLVDNLASRRVMEKLGMHEAGRFVFPAQRRGALETPAMDAVVYTLRREDRPT